MAVDVTGSLLLLLTVLSFYRVFIIPSIWVLMCGWGRHTCRCACKEHKGWLSRSRSDHLIGNGGANWRANLLYLTVVTATPQIFDYERTQFMRVLMETHAFSVERAFERLEALELDESNVRFALQKPELPPSIREQLVRVSDRITAEREQLMRVVVACNGGTIAKS